MARFHDVNIYWGSLLVTSSTRLEVAARSPYLHQLMTSITVCDGCKEPTTLIFPAEDETQNTLQEMFKSLSVRTGQSRYSIVESKKFYKTLDWTNLLSYITRSTGSLRSEGEAGRDGEGWRI